METKHNDMINFIIILVSMDIYKQIYTRYIIILYVIREKKDK